MTKKNGKTKPNGKFVINGGFTASPLNPCRAVVKNEPSRRFFLAEGLIRGGQFKKCWRYGAIQWGKQIGLDKDASISRFAELMPSTPYAIRYVLNEIQRQNEARGIKVKTIFAEDGEVTVRAVK
jgi:hypothetical protein